jgi:hypothetical protein
MQLTAGLNQNGPVGGGGRMKIPGELRRDLITDALSVPAKTSREAN